MNVVPTPESEAYVQSIVDSRCFKSPTDVVSEALRLLEHQDQFLALHKDQIRRKINEGRESLERGEVIDGDELFDRIEAEFDALERRP